MTYTIELRQPGFRIRDRFEAGGKAAAGRMRQHSVYFRTLRILRAISDRNLADVGISRMRIKEIAHEAAYGQKH